MICTQQRILIFSIYCTWYRTDLRKDDFQPFPTQEHNTHTFERKLLIVTHRKFRNVNHNLLDCSKSHAAPHTSDYCPISLSRPLHYKKWRIRAKQILFMPNNMNKVRGSAVCVRYVLLGCLYVRFEVKHAPTITVLSLWRRVLDSRSHEEKQTQTSTETTRMVGWNVTLMYGYSVRVCWVVQV